MSLFRAEQPSPALVEMRQRETAAMVIHLAKQGIEDERRIRSILGDTGAPPLTMKESVDITLKVMGEAGGDPHAIDLIRDMVYEAISNPES